VALIEIVREVRLTPAESWRRLTAWDQHGHFVPLTRITVTPTGFDAFTGWAELQVEPIPSGSRVTWREDIHVRGTPRLADGLTRASSRALFSRVIDGLLA
jgi:hypothetical protein